MKSGINILVCSCREWGEVTSVLMALSNDDGTVDSSYLPSYLHELENWLDGDHDFSTYAHSVAFPARFQNGSAVIIDLNYHMKHED